MSKLKSILLIAILGYAVAHPTSEVDATAARAKEEKYQRYIGEKNYQLPFKTRISEPLKEGQTIHILGTIGNDPKQIDITFHQGADMPFHLSILFEETFLKGRVATKLIYNTFKDDLWSKDEQAFASCSGTVCRVERIIYRPNEDFDIRIRILNGTYVVYGDHYPLVTFEQRMGFEDVDHISLSGDLVRMRLFRYGGTIFPNPYIAIAQLSPGKRLDVSAIPKRLKCPERGWSFSRVIDVIALADCTPEKRIVNVNLYRKNGDVALQISIRYDETDIVRNSMIDSKWGREERRGRFDLKKAQVFDLTVINEESGFQIFVNGKRHATFVHRGSPNDIETLGIDGDVETHSVTINAI